MGEREERSEPPARIKRRRDSDEGSRPYRGGHEAETQKAQERRKILTDFSVFWGKKKGP